MMTREDIQLMYEYDRWANNRVFQAVSTLRTEQFTYDLGGSFRSVRDVLLHIVGSEWTWLRCWKEPSPSSALLSDFWNQHDAMFTPDAFAEFSAVQRRWAEVEREQAEFVNCVTEASLARMLPIDRTEISLRHLMQHVANHSTYHRGQVSLMMRQLSAEPLATDFTMFLMKGR